MQTADNTTRPKRNVSKPIWLTKDLGSLGKAHNEEDPQKATVSSEVAGRKHINESSTADVLSEGGQQKTKHMPSTGDTVSSAAASKSSPPDSPSKSDVDDESSSDSDASMITASTKLYKRKRQLKVEAQSSSDSDDTEDSGGKFKCVRLVIVATLTLPLSDNIPVAVLERDF